MGLISGLKDPLEKGMATHSSVLAWRIPWTEEPGRLQSLGNKESDLTEETLHTHICAIHNPQTFLRSLQWKNLARYRTYEI